LFLADFKIQQHTKKRKHRKKPSHSKKKREVTSICGMSLEEIMDFEELSGEVPRLVRLSIDFLRAHG